MKTIIISGSSRGIGMALTKKLLSRNDVEIIGTSTSGKNSLQDDYFRCLPLKLEDKNSIEEFAKLIENKKIDYLVNNAGVLMDDWNESKIDFQNLLKTFEINLFGTIRFTEALLSQFNPGAHIVNVTSEWGSFSEKNFDEFLPHYKMSKAALNMYTKLLAERLKSKQIKVSALDPGWVKTDMGGMQASRTSDEVANELLNLLEGDYETGKFWHRGKIRKW
ncbi:SDR family NAD(P)-dependent oxidoreductase [uncultured Draconibacterium sp.]|uniref:SDR family NAD(P)-dependent oxidoreductase n=1 Tax=uncultured Draconibacterium sp. TaxID=1573823 RepID=UPI0029C8AC03|nr:SDR family NAD(P)-dependent oxidoreductase [uncultured Draconibacterium sp.]